MNVVESGFESIRQSTDAAIFRVPEVGIIFGGGGTVAANSGTHARVIGGREKPPDRLHGEAIEGNGHGLLVLRYQKQIGEMMAETLHDEIPEGTLAVRIHG